MLTQMKSSKYIISVKQADIRSVELDLFKRTRSVNCTKYILNN